MPPINESGDPKDTVTFLQMRILDLEKKNQCLENELRAKAEYEAHLKHLIKEREDFVSILGHEIRTPLTSATLQNQMLRRFLDDVELTELTRSKIDRSLKICEWENSRMKRLVHNVLDNTQIRAGTFSLDCSFFDLAQVAREVIAGYDHQSPLSQKNAMIIESLVSIEGFWDRNRIEQLFHNLISNALKYGNGKPIKISIERGQPEVSCLIRVKDQGIGIPEDKIDVIFKKFERSCQEHQNSGLGLGLYIVKQIIDAHNGSISVKSAPQQGSEFIVELPIRCPSTVKNRYDRE